MLRTVSLPHPLNSRRLYLCAMPGRFEGMEVFLEDIAVTGIKHILCLVSDGEIAQKSPDYLVAIGQNRIPAKLWRYDVPDYGLPENTETLNRMIDGIRECLNDCQSVVIHCAAGCGRTGMIAILLLTRIGLPLEIAIQTIRLAGAEPDTQAQWDFVQKHAHR
jgi:protein-tyrosine phosphatase